MENFQIKSEVYPQRPALGVWRPGSFYFLCQVKSCIPLVRALCLRAKREPALNVDIWTATTS